MGYIARSTAPIRLKAFLVGCCDANGALADVREYLGGIMQNLTVGKTLFCTHS